jgi:hypothetical protein
VHRRRKTVLEIHILCLNWAAVCGLEQNALRTADVKLHYTIRFSSSLRRNTVRCH